MVGQTLAHYKILEKIGSGGMGDVYLAEDTKLSRKIALKVLPPELAESEERRARFKREAKALAALDHPNIVQVFSVEEAQGVHFITMQLVRGKTLTELLPKNGFPLNKFFDIAIPLADAVAAAHQEGITHRDLKPDNAMVGDDGRIKVLDFGLAKPTRGFVGGDADSALPTAAKTAEGVIVGTVNYMSPEHAEGKAVDARSDIFSLGIIFFEMLTGERPFRGDTATSVLSSIIKDTPDSVTSLKPGIPRELTKIVRRCLAKEPTRRYQSALDVRNELEELRQEHDSGGFSEASAVKRGGVSYALVASLLGAVAFLSAVATYVLIDMQPGSESDPGTLEGTFTQLTSQPGEEYFPSIAPDGDSFVYASYTSGNWDIYLRRVEGERAINLTEDSLAEDTQPVFSPDGQQIAFRSERDGGGLFVMGATGESVRRVSTRGFNPAWSPDGEEIVFGTERILQPNNRTSVSQLWITNAATGDERLLTNGDAVQPHWSPGGERIAYWAVGEGAVRDLWTVSRDGDAPMQVTTDAFVDWNPVWSPDGQHLYFSSDRGGNMNVWRVAMDESTGKVVGEPEAVTTGAVARAWQLSLSRDGRRIVYAAAVQTSNIMKANLNIAGTAVDGPLVPITKGSMFFVVPELSHDGQFVAFTTGVTPQDIYVTRADGTDMRQLTNDVAKDRAARWSPDDRRIAFFSDRGGTNEIWTIRADGSGLRQLTHVNSTPSTMYPTWSPDGKQLAYYVNQVGSFLMNTSRPWQQQTPSALPPMVGSTTFAVWNWSPDGAKIAGFVVHPDGRYAGIVVYSLASQTYDVLTDFGAAPVWLSDTRRLLFTTRQEIRLLDTETREHLEVFGVDPPKALTVFGVAKDDRSIYFGLIDRQADIWMLTFEEGPR